jgi:hypothetical protein
MTESEWVECNDPVQLLEFLRGKASDRCLRLFCAACCRRVWHLLVDEQSRAAVEIVERFADGQATDNELEAAKSNAWEFSNHTVHNDDRFFELAQDALDAADAPAWAAEWHEAYPVRVVVATQRALGTSESNVHADLLRCIFGNPFSLMLIIPPTWVTWRDGTVANLARAAYDERELPSGHLDAVRLAILADATEDTGCKNQQFLEALREKAPRYRGFFALDLVLGKR